MNVRNILKIANQMMHSNLAELLQKFRDNRFFQSLTRSRFQDTDRTHLDQRGSSKSKALESHRMSTVV